MSKMFDNYPQPEGYIPNNRPRCRIPHTIDIMAGETAEHSFEVPFNVDESCDSFEVIYKLGINPIIIKNQSHLEKVITEHGTTLITCKLSSDETSMFGDTLLSAKVQLKFYMKNNTISYSEIYKVNLRDSLDEDRTQPVPPKPGTLGGLGYTED